MIKELKKMWATPSAETLALKELEESKRSLLEAQTARDYAQAMCTYREAQIRRLTSFLHSATKEQP
jgi:hypothetical protein